MNVQAAEACGGGDTGNKKSSTTLIQTDRRFNPTKTGLVGVQRETMLSSELQYLVNNKHHIFFLHRRRSQL